jgi:uncharacterized protein (UPF0332 family)
MNQRERLRQTRENVEDAKLLYGEKIGTKVVFTKLYHALMYCLFALFDLRISGNFTHAEVIDRFELEYVRRGAFDEELLRVIRHAYDLTHECDCNHMPMPSDREVDEAVRFVVRFIEETERFLTKEMKKHESSAV